MMKVSQVTKSQEARTFPHLHKYKSIHFVAPQASYRQRCLSQDADNNQVTGTTALVASTTSKRWTVNTPELNSFQLHP